MESNKQGIRRPDRPTIDQLDAWYRGQPEAIDVCCRRLLAEIMRRDGRKSMRKGVRNVG